jgi:DNA topoisomerase VI subunit B
MSLDFFTEQKLVAQCGFPKEDWPLMVLKELLDNALDICEERGLEPNVVVIVDDGGISVRDNGPGIPTDVVEKVLDFSNRVSSRAAYVQPSRGCQGNGLKVLVALPYVLGDGTEAGRLTIAACGVRHEIEVGLDQIRREPKVDHQPIPDRTVKSGTFFKLWWPDLARSLLDEQKSRFLRFAEDYTWINPHLTLEIHWKRTDQ